MAPEANGDTYIRLHTPALDDYERRVRPQRLIMDRVHRPLQL